MKNLVLLHSSGDIEQLRLLAGLASEDAELTGFRPWIDAPRPRDRDVSTLDGSAPIDVQIQARIAEADAIVYCVGNTGAGVYQEQRESDLVRETILAREASGSPIHFIPTILKDGSEDDLPNWARAYAVINHDRSLKRAPQLWDHIKQRLDSAPQVVPLDLSIRPKPRADQIQRILNTLADRPQLTAFVGPYSLDSNNGAPNGPAALTQDLLAHMGLPVAADSSIVPWPSEAAEWLRFTDSIHDAHELLRKRLKPLGLKPPELALNIGYLAERWIQRYGERKPQEKDWQGLLLLTTRVDLALESALARHSAVGFTRILPTLNNASASADRRQMVQQWRADPNWFPDPAVAERSEAPCDDIADDLPNQLSTFPLDAAKRVILVKLCGSLEVPSSIVLTGSDFFQNSGNFSSLPKGINEAIGASPHLFLGRGFTSPLAQLVRFNVLPRLRSDLPRVWLLPNPPPAKLDGSDVLCDLELNLLVDNEAAFIRTLNASAVHRGEEHIFIRHLAERL